MGEEGSRAVLLRAPGQGPMFFVFVSRVFGGLGLCFCFSRVFFKGFWGLGSRVCLRGLGF